MGGLWFMSVNLFTNILLIVSINLLIYTKYFTWINVLILGVVTFIAYIIVLALVNFMTIFNSVGTIKDAFFSAKLWMNIIYVGGTCGIIDFFILGFNYIYKPSSAKELQLLMNKKVDMDNISTNELPKKIRKKIESYNEFKGEDENLKKEITQRKPNDNNDEMKLKLKNGGNGNSTSNLENCENQIAIKDKNIKINSELDDSRKITTIKDSKYLENKIVQKKDNYFGAEVGENPSIINQKKNLNNDNKNNEYARNNDVIFYNQEHGSKVKMKDDDSHSRSALITNKKGHVDDTNDTKTQQNKNKSIYI